MSRLEIEGDRQAQRTEWIAERAGWAVLAVIVVAAALGAFGGGPLSHARASADAGRLVVDYDWIVRKSAATELSVRAAVPDGAGEIRLWIDRSYLRDLDVSGIVPEPGRMEDAGGRVALVFSASASREPLEVVLRVEPRRAGRLSGRIGVAGGPEVAVRQFAFF